jgi:hypothetical protein
MLVTSVSHFNRVAHLQMEKRCAGANPAERYARCRMILQRGLALNPESTRLLQVGPAEG